MSLLFLAAAAAFRRSQGNSPFLGEVPASDFITGDALAAAINLNVGISINSNEPWLKFKDPVDGKTKYVSKKPIRHSLGWSTLDSRGAVFGSKQITIGEDTFKVRLFKTLPDGVNNSPLSSASSSHPWDPVETHGSEWNRLMYHISGKPFANASNTLQSEGIEEGDWAQYSEADLGFTGIQCFCQETVASGDYRYLRGGSGVSSLSIFAYNRGDYANRGWRPVLELIE